MEINHLSDIRFKGLVFGYLTTLVANLVLVGCQPGTFG